MISHWTKIGEANHHPKALAYLVKRAKSIVMLVIGRYDFIPFAPVDTIGNDIHSFTGIIGQGNLPCLRIEKTRNARPRIIADRTESLPYRRSYAAIRMLAL